MSNDMTMELLTSRDAREAQMDNVWVLNKVKALALIPSSDYATTQMVANYYETSENTIYEISHRYRDELNADGMRVCRAKEFWNVHNGHSKISKRRGGSTVEFNDGSTIEVPNAGLRLYPRRAILRIGMLLRDSDIAKAIRSALLDAADSHQTFTEQVIEDKQSDTNEVMNYLKAQLDKRDAQLDKCLSMMEILLQRQIELEAPIQQRATQRSKKKPSITVTTKNMSTTPTWSEWKMEINNILKDIADLTHRSNDSILHEAYQRLDGQYGLCTAQCIADYKKSHVKQDPAMMSVMYWYETEKNPDARGLLASVLNTMCDEMLLKAA